MTPDEERPAETLADDVEIPISFGLGSTTLPLREFKSIQPGYVFLLDGGATNPVVIDVNGTTIGSGDLILVDGRLAVQFNEATSNGIESP